MVKDSFERFKALEQAILDLDRQEAGDISLEEQLAGTHDDAVAGKEASKRNVGDRPGGELAAMTWEQILQRVEEIKDRMQAGKMLQSSAGSDDVIWLCRVVQQLAARLERLEAVAEAARPFADERNWEDGIYLGPMEDERNLRQALAALEEDGDAG